MVRKLLILLIIVCLFFAFFTSDIQTNNNKILFPKAEAAAPSASWWDSKYMYRQKITISAGVNSIPANYSVSVSFTHNSLVTALQSLSNGNDVRIVYWNGSTWSQLDRLLDDQSAWNNAATRVWFRTQAQINANQSDDNYYLYYGYASASTPPTNWVNIFQFYDTFTGSEIDTSRWTCLTGTCTVASGVLTVNSSSSIYQTVTYQAGTNTRTEARLRTGSTTGFADIMVLSDEFPVAGSGTDYLSFYKYTSTANQVFSESSTNGTSGPLQNTAFTASTLTSDQNFIIDRIGTTSVVYTTNTTVRATHTSYIPTGNLRIGFLGNTMTVRPAFVRTRLYVSPEPTNVLGSLERINFAQTDYRFYANLNSATVGSPLALQDTPATAPAAGTPFRLRLAIQSVDRDIPSAGPVFKLQFALRSGTCDTTFTGETYADVSPSAGTIRYFNNASVSDGVENTSNVNDPVTGGTNVSQTYEESNTLTSIAAMSAGNYGIWDFSLVNNSATAGDIYCFRIVFNSNSTLLTTYSVIPEIQIPGAGTLSVDMVDSGGASVATPTSSMSISTTSFDCSSTSGTLGTSSQRLRISNTTLTPAWSVSIAATSGNTALWTSGANTFDFNDLTSSGCADGADADSSVGRLTINPSVSTSSPQSGCTNTNVTLGTSNNFNQGTLDSITLISAGSSANTNCYWDVTGIELSQTIPAEQLSGTYTLGLTITVVAQ